MAEYTEQVRRNSSYRAENLKQSPISKRQRHPGASWGSLLD